MRILYRLLNAFRQAIWGLCLTRTFDQAWQLHERGDLLAAAVAYGRLGDAAVPLAVLALQLDQAIWAQKIMIAPAAASSFVWWVVLRLKTAPLHCLDPLEAAEALLGKLNTSQQKVLHDFSVRIPANRGRVYHLRGLCLAAIGDQTQATQAFALAVHSAKPDTRGLEAWLERSGEPRDFERIRAACEQIADENAAFALLLLESVHGGLSREGLLRFALTQPMGVRSMIEQFTDRLPTVSSILAGNRTLAGFLSGLREEVSKAILSICAGNPDAVALISMANMGRLGADYLAPFARPDPRYPMLLLVLASAKVPHLDEYPVPVLYVDEVLLARDHGFRLGICDGATTLAMLLPERMILATVVHGAFTLPAAEKYFWADAASYFDFILLGGPEARNDLREGLEQFARTSLGKTDRTPVALIDGSVSPARSRRKRVFLEAVGLPRLDAHLRDGNAAPPIPTITFAPTAPQNLPAGMSALAHAEKILAYLLVRFPGWKTVFRPYPHALSEPIVEKIRDRFGSSPNFIFDSGIKSTAEVYRSTTVFVTDASTGGFSFQAATLRPAIFFLPKAAPFNRRFRRFLRQCRKFSNVAVTIDQIGDAVDTYLADPTEFAHRAGQFRQEQVFYLGESVQKYSEWLDRTMSGLPAAGLTVDLKKGPLLRRDRRDQCCAPQAPPEVPASY